MVRAILLILVVVSTGSVAAHEHSDVRQFVIRSQLAQAGDDSIVIVGDSIAESALLPTEVCGHQLINAGVGGMTAGSYLQTIIRGIPEFKASAIVIALGTNDALSRNENFGRDYEQFVAILSPYSETILLAGLPSVGEQFDQDIRSIAKRRGLPFIDLRSDSEAATIDGIHLSPEGYKPWMRAILGGIRHALHC